MIVTEAGEEDLGPPSVNYIDPYATDSRPRRSSCSRGAMGGWGSSPYRDALPPDGIRGAPRAHTHYMPRGQDPYGISIAHRSPLVFRFRILREGLTHMLSLSSLPLRR